MSLRRLRFLWLALAVAVLNAGAQPSHGGHCALCAMPAALPAPQATLPAPATVACAAAGLAPTAYLPCFTAATPPATGPPALG